MMQQLALQKTMHSKCQIPRHDFIRPQNTGSCRRVGRDARKQASEQISWCPYLKKFISTLVGPNGVLSLW